MKRITLKSFAAVVAVAAVLSSCLGDSHSKVEYNNAISYVVEGKSGGKNALTNVGGVFSFVTADYLKKLPVDKFYTLNYKVNTQDGTNADGAYNAHSMMPQGLGDPVPETSAGRNINMPTYPLEIHPVDASVAFYSGFESGLDDKFVFNYQCEVDPGDLNPAAEDYSDNVHLVATYVESNQTTPVEGGGTEALKPNQIIVNLSLFKDVDYASEGEKKIVYRGLGAIDMKEIRREFNRRGIRPEEGRPVGEGWIVFQYTKNLGDGKTEVRPLGSFTDSRIAYGMYFPEDE